MVSIRELSHQEEGAGHTFLKIEPLHAPSVVYETGDSDPTTASSPVSTPASFEATGLRYRFLAHDPANPARISEVAEWTAKIRLKYQLHNRGDHYEVELLALPKASGIAIRYTTDGASPTSAGAATYDGAFRVPAKCRILGAMAVSSGYDLKSETIRIPIPQKGQEERTLDATIPARWHQQTKLDDSGAVWDLIQRLENTAGVNAYDISLTAESSDGQQNVEYSGVLEGGYDAAALKSVAEKSPPPRQRPPRRQVSEEPRQAGPRASLAGQRTLHPVLGRRGCLARRHPECTAQLGSAGPRRALVALHHDGGHNRPGHAERHRLAQSAPGCHCRQALRSE